MKQWTKNVVVTFLSAFFLLASAQAAFAKPKWLKTTYKVEGLVAVGKDINKPGYLAVKVKIGHTNNNKNGEIVTVIYNKKLMMTADLTTILSKNGKFSGTFISTNINKVGELYPGQRQNLIYYLRIDDKSIQKSPHTSWKEVNKDIVRFGIAEFKNWTCTYDCEVRTIK